MVWLCKLSCAAQPSQPRCRFELNQLAEERGAPLADTPTNALTMLCFNTKDVAIALWQGSNANFNGWPARGSIEIPNISYHVLRLIALDSQRFLGTTDSFPMCLVLGISNNVFS